MYYILLKISQRSAGFHVPCSFNTEVWFSTTAPHIHNRIELTKNRCKVDVITYVSEALKM